MRVAVLGPTRIWRGDQEVQLPAGNVGSLLRLFLLRPDEARSALELQRVLWPGSEDQRGDRHRLQVTVSRLRSFLSEERLAEGSWQLTVSDGRYSLSIPPGGLDRRTFEELAAAALSSGDVTVATQALELWRGHPYEGFPMSPEVAAEAAALGELRRRLFDLCATADSAETVPAAKVQPPWPAGTLLERRLATSAPAVGEVDVLAVVAPPGFGKSTLLAQWAARQTAPVAWVNLDPGDEDPVRLWRAIGRALGEAFGVGPDALVGHGVDARAGSAAMLEDLASRRGSKATFGLVLDDLHVLRSANAVDEVARLLRSLPMGATVAIATREQVPAALSEDGAGRRLRTLSEADLRFALEEVEQLVGDDDERARWLHERTDGWPVAVTALHRSGAELTMPPPPAMAQYIDDEVISLLPEWVERIVVQIVHLDAFTVDLCEAVTGQEDAGAALAWLRARGLFLVDTGDDADQGWSRFHPMIAAVARRRGAATLNLDRIWRRAAVWHRDHGFDEAALGYAVKAGDRATIGALAGGVLLDSALRGEGVRCVQWLQRIRPDDLADDFRSHGIAVYLAVEWMDRDDRASWLRSRSLHFGDADDGVGVLVAAIEAMREGREAEAIERSELVVHRCLEGTWPEVGELSQLLLGSAFSNLLRAKVLSGELKHDDPLFPSAVTLLRPHAPLLAAFVHSFWGLVALVDGEVDIAESLAEEQYQARLRRELGRPAKRSNSVLGALLASLRTTAPERLLEIARDIEDIPPLHERKGQHTEGTLAMLALAAIYRRAGFGDHAEPLERRAAGLRRTFADTAFLDRYDQWLMGSLGGSQHAPGSTLGSLTPRQREVAAHLASTLSLDEIAEKLFISRHTLRTHLREIYRRLGVGSRHEAIVRLDHLAESPRR